MAQNPEERQQSEADSLFNSLRSPQPARVMDDSEEDENLGGIANESISERMEESPNLTDVQSALKVLLPKMTRYLNPLQVSRVFPDTYNALFRLLVKDLLQEDDSLSVGEAIATVTTVLSIAIDGEGRIDVIALYGKASDTEIAKSERLGIV